MDGLGAERYREIVRFLTPWFRDLQGKMNLGGWFLEFIDNLDRLPDEQGSGGIYRFIGQRSAEIYLSEWSLGKHSPYELKLTILHEMVHCHTQPMWEEHRHLERRLGPLIWDFLGPTYAAHEENIADGLANTFAPLLPDPPDWRHLLSPTMEVAEYPQEGLTTLSEDDGDGEIKPIGIIARDPALAEIAKVAEERATPEPEPLPVPDELPAAIPAWEMEEAQEAVTEPIDTPRDRPRRARKPLY